MSVSIENTSTLGRKMRVSIPAAEIDQKTSSELNKLKSKVKLAGFRTGKIPLSVIKQHFGETTRHNAIADLIKSTYQEAVKTHNLKTAGLPHIEAEPSKFGEPLSYIATFEVLPEIKIADMDGVKVEKLSAEITAKEIDEMLLDIRKKHATWVETDRKAQKGDQLVIDFAGEIDGKFFDGGTAKDFRFELGAGNMLQDFEDGLKDAKPNTEVKFTVNFPKDYSDKTVAGHKATFTVKIHKVLAPKLAELNDELFKKLGIAENGEEVLRAKIRKNLETTLKSKIDANFKKQVLDKLLELNAIEVPKIMVENEARNLQNQAKQWFSYYTKTPLEKVQDIPLENFINEATKRVKLGLLLTEIVKLHQIKVSNEQLEQKIESIAAVHENPSNIVKWYHKDQKRLIEAESAALEDLVIDKLAAQLTVVQKHIAFSDLLKEQDNG